MEHKWRDILGQMQPLEPGTIDSYVTDAMGVFLPRKPIGFSDIDYWPEPQKQYKSHLEKTA